MLLHKRTLQMIVIFMVVMLGFIIRLGYIQLIATDHFSKYEVDLVEESIKQRTETFVLNSGRGYFKDMHGEPLNADYYACLILFPFLKNGNWPVTKVSKILNVNEGDILNSLSSTNRPFVLEVAGKPYRLSGEQVKKINQLKIPGVFAQYFQQRTENLAPHLIGVTGENSEEVKQRYREQVTSGSISIYSEIGVSGLQRAFDPFLLSQGNASLVYFVDNHSKPLFGFDVKYTAPASPYHPTEVITTIDRQIQALATETLEDVGILNGGLVILDAKTSDLRALVSLPSFNINFPFDEGAKNHLVTTNTPGSIFKIVVAAAAIDFNLINKSQLYDCNKNLYSDGEEPRQLGLLTFQESFAQSCNYTFSFLANELIKIDKQILQKYAKKLGLVDKVGWTGDVYRLEEIKHFPEEEQGRVIIDDQDTDDFYALAQTAIGQKNVRVTPLAVANMLATIARGGEKQQVRAAAKINYENGSTVVQFPLQKAESEERISKYTAMRLQGLLRSVVEMEKGTAHFLNNEAYPIAGKTGTAQRGMNKDELSHWFAGYFPADNPRYVMVIIDLDHQSGGTKTLKAFQTIVEFLDEYDK